MRNLLLPVVAAAAFLVSCKSSSNSRPAPVIAPESQSQAPATTPPPTADTDALRLPAIFSDHLVLQQKRPIPVWGWAPPRTEVTVALAGEEATGHADGSGKWLVELEALPAGGPHELTVKTDTKTLTLTDVLIGEVWLCSGQSNMQWSVENSNNAAEEVAAADHPQVRLFSVTRKVAHERMDDIQDAAWQVCSPDTVGAFSAVGYYFGRELNQQLDAPIGLIDSSWGGTPSESWTSRTTLAATPEAQPILTRFEKALTEYPVKREAWLKAMDEWKNNPGQKPAYHTDPGNTGVAKGYADPDFDDSTWETARLPGNFDAVSNDLDGAVWYRRVVEVPGDIAEQPVILELGPIDDFDVTYVNGREVGATNRGPDSWTAERKYTLPVNLLKPGKNTITVRVFDHFGGGGVTGPASKMALRAENGLRLPLAGEWKTLVEHRLDPLAVTGPNAGAPQEPLGPNSPWGPGSLFNGMIAPLVPYGIRGATWYQGESNADRAEQYRTIFPAMIADWREQWGQGDFPFLFVQLANYMAPSDEPTDTAWAHLRDAQLHTLRTVKNTGMAVAIDIGEANDIHPRNKQDVGKRLARWALADVYDQKDVVKSGPLPKDIDFSGDAASVRFDSIGQGLKTRDGGPVAGFTIAGEDQVFHNADATITGDGVVVSSPAVPKPAAVRYAWENNPTEANLVNSEGLPATPFRSDDWPGPTDGKR